VIHQQALLFWGLLGAIAILVGIAVVVLLREAGYRDLRRRVILVASGPARRMTPRMVAAPSRRSSFVSEIGCANRRESTRSRISRFSRLSLSTAGFDPRKVLPLVLGAKLAFLISALAVAGLIGITTDAGAGKRLLLVAIAFPVGIMVPEFVLNIFRRSHAAALRRGLPDALDLLVVCTEAGLGLESALKQVSIEIRNSNRAIALALASLLDELMVLPDRRQAFTNFGRRSGVEAIRRMSTVLAQTLQLGTPLGDALRSMAVELRHDRMIHLEEKAVRLPALLVFPLIFCILPTLLIVLGGPSVLTLLDTLQSTSLVKH
jgi:Flp pilus assembly protein TadC